jgi:hypothetical protein
MGMGVGGLIVIAYAIFLVDLKAIAIGGALVDRALFRLLQLD